MDIVINISPMVASAIIVAISMMGTAAISAGVAGATALAFTYRRK